MIIIEDRRFFYNKDTLFGVAYDPLPDSVYSIVCPEITIPAGQTDTTFEVSTDGSTWTMAGEFTMEDQNGSWQKVAFDSPQEDVRYLKYTVTSTYGDIYYTNMAEFKVY